MGAIRLSYQALQVLRLFLDKPTQEQTGGEIISACRLASGTVYPLLLRFERVGFLESRWEAGNASELGRPRRRYYRITGDGQAAVQDAIRVLAPTAAFLTPEGI
jgi:PadR family transcriptional regulator, regulatory protein PadR